LKNKHINSKNFKEQNQIIETTKRIKNQGNKKNEDTKEMLSINQLE